MAKPAHVLSYRLMEGYVPALRTGFILEDKFHPLYIKTVRRCGEMEQKGVWWNIWHAAGTGADGIPRTLRSWSIRRIKNALRSEVTKLGLIYKDGHILAPAGSIYSKARGTIVIQALSPTTVPKYTEVQGAVQDMLTRVLPKLTADGKIKEQRELKKGQGRRPAMSSGSRPTFSVFRKP